MKPSDIKARTNGIIAEIDAAELACRIAEKALGLKRPEGTTGIQAMTNLDPEQASRWLGAAKVAMEYVTECIDRAPRKN